MEDIGRLNEAFNTFTVASKSLELIYEKLKERVHYLTIELEEKNKQLEQALSDTEEAKDYLKGILESLSESIIVTDSNDLVTMFNRASVNLLRIAESDAVGKPIDSLDFTIETEGPDTFLNVDNNQYNVLVSRSEVTDSEGAVRGKVFLLQDITRLKELETQHERNKRLIAMGEMAAQIVHEIRSPLCSIELYASMLENELGLSPHATLARGISTGIRSLNNILTNMLFFAKPQKPLFHNIKISTVAEESLNMLLPLIEARGITLCREVEGPAAVVKGDLELLKQVLMNIIINAVHVTPENGTIKIIETVENNMAVIKVIDEGEGISHQNIERIFDPFFSTKERGTGLGLAIASKIMLVHQGAIKVKSEHGSGSSFEMNLPLSAVATVEKEQ
ncbi:MAG: ATP-binding protein [Nitrospirae bacterium YQR-1]